MSRFIDADALLEDWGIDIEPIKRRPIQTNEFRDFMRRYENHPYYFAILAIALATTADVIEVVRCKDCKWLDTYTINGEDITACNNENAFFRDVRCDEHCSCGERKEDGKVH